MCDDSTKDNFLNGKVIGEFKCSEIASYSYAEVSTDVGIFGYYEHLGSGCDCLCDEELMAYGRGGAIYGWHISGLKIYEVPKVLYEFGLSRAPQSWCYVEGNVGE